MDVLLDVQQSSDVLVKETVTFTFVGQFSFVTRAIPTRNVDSIGDITVEKDGVRAVQGRRHRAATRYTTTAVTGSSS